MSLSEYHSHNLVYLGILGDVDGTEDESEIKSQLYKMRVVSSDY